MHSSLGSTQWSLTATLLVGAVASPVIGRLGDGRHRKLVILLCLVSVTLGGALAGLAGNLPLLVAGRAMQGMGLALMSLTMASARDHLPARESSRVIAMLSVVGAVGVGLGYPITGLIAERFDISAAFWFGAAVSGMALALSALVIPSSLRVDPDASVDVKGAVAIGAGVLCLLIALEKGATWGWGSSATVALFAAAAALIAVWTRHELATTDPLVDLRLVRHRAVLTADVAGLMLGVAMYMSLSIMTQYVQLPKHLGFGFGASVFVAGLSLLPLSACSFLASASLPRFQRRVGSRPVIPAGSALVGIAALFFALTGDRLWQAFVTMGVIGLGLGFTFAAMPGLIVGAVPATETGSAMGFYQVTRYIGFSVGSGLSVTLLRAFGHHGVPTAGAYRATFLAAALLCGATGAITWLLPGRGRRRASAGGDLDLGDL